jgi:hypothetical protein
MRFVRPGAPSATDAPTALRAHVEPTLVLWCTLRLPREISNSTSH